MKQLLKVSQQTLWQLLGKTISSVTAFITLTLIARNYGQEGLGIYTLAVTYLTIFFIVVDLGFNAYVLTLLELGKDKANDLFNIRFYWSLFLSLIALLVSFIIPIGDSLFKTAVIMGLITILANGIYNSANLVFQFKLRYERSTIAVCLGAITYLVTMITLVAANTAPQLLILALSLGWLVNSLASLFLVGRFHKFNLTRPNFFYFWQLLKKVWPISATLILNVIYFRFDAFILAATRSLSEAGIYNLSFTIFQTALVLPTFIMNSYYPIILKELKDKNLLFNQLKVVFGIMIGISILGTVFTFMLSSLIIDLIGGDKFKDSVTSLKILSLSFPAFFTSALLMWVFVSFKKYLVLLYIYFVGLLVNVGLNFIYTPTYSYISTSWITVFSEYFILLLLLLALWLRFRKGVQWS